MDEVSSGKGYKKQLYLATRLGQMAVRLNANKFNYYYKYHLSNQYVMEKMSDILFKIEKTVNGGYGLTHNENGLVILLRHVLPGELVKARIVEEKKDFAEAVVTAIVEASASRIIAPCRQYGKCGGCDWQCYDYDLQLLSKKGILQDLLEDAPHRALQEAVTLVAAPLASPRIFGYRQRLRLQIDEHGQPGFRRFHSHQGIAITECLLARPELNSALQQLQSQAAFHCLSAITTELELLFNPASSRVVCLFHLARKPRPTDMQQAGALLDTLPLLEMLLFCGPNFLPCGPTIGHNKNKETTELQLLLPPFPGHTETVITLSWKAGGFCQVNPEQNIQLIQTVLDFCQPDLDTSILDLFCGMGNFSIPLAMQAASLLGIEGQGSAIRSARRNSQRAGLTNTIFEKSPIHKYCRTLAVEGRSFDCVIIDPPRQGAPGLALALAAITRKRLVYISCDPATLCRDLAELTDAGFSIKRLQPVDMFPQTHHIETVVLLER